METLGMKLMALLLTGLLVAGTAIASDVYVTTDAKGNKIYTDTPQSIPAQKLDIHSQSTDPAAAAQEYSSEMKRYGQDDKADSKAQAQQAAAQQAAQTTAEDKAKRCVDARQRYQTLMDNWRVYEPGPNGERTYLTSEQIDAARANAKKSMDEFCADQ
jgi:hypothetical protein